MEYVTKKIKTKNIDSVNGRPRNWWINLPSPKKTHRKNRFKGFSKFVLRRKPIWAAMFLILMMIGNFGGFELVGEAKNLAKKNISGAEKDFEKLPHVEVDAKDVFFTRGAALADEQRATSGEKETRHDFQAGEDPEFEIEIPADGSATVLPEATAPADQPIQNSSSIEVGGAESIDGANNMKNADEMDQTGEGDLGNKIDQPASDSLTNEVSGGDTENQADGAGTQKNILENISESFKGILGNENVTQEPSSGAEGEIDTQQTEKPVSFFPETENEFGKLSKIFEPKENFSSAKNKKLAEAFWSRMDGWVGIGKANAADSKIVKTEVLDSSGSVDGKIQTAVEENAGIATITILKPERAFKPGKYSLRVEMLSADGTQVLTSTQDFTWGVLAINVNKSIFSPDETAKIAMAVLDDQGNMVCDANLKLDITDPSGDTKTLSTDDEDIKINKDICASHAFTLDPDYAAEYKVGEWGTYSMTLTAETSNGTHQIQDSFEVSNLVPFDVERVTATRIYPKNVYPVTFNIIANQDFDGEIQETVPESFEISKGDEGNQGDEEGWAGYDSIKTKDKENILTWNVSLKKGENIKLGYQFKAPEESPQFYLLGPLQFKEKEQTIFEEARQWQIASDAPTLDTSKNFTGTGATVSTSYTAGSGSGLMVLGIVVVGTTTRTGAAPTYNGVTMKQVGEVQVAAETNVEMWYLINPDTGSSHTISIPNSGGRTIYADVSTYIPDSGKQFILDNFNEHDTTATSINPSLTLPISSSDEVIVDVMGGGSNSPTTANSHTTLYSNDDGAYSDNYQYTLAPTPGNVTFSWTFGAADDYSMIMAAFKQYIPANGHSASLENKRRFSGSSNPLTESYEVGAGADLMVLGIVVAGNVARTGGVPTYNGVEMIPIGDTKMSVETNVEMWYLRSPPAGSFYTISIPNAGSLTMYANVSTYFAGPEKNFLLETFDGYGTVASEANPSLTLSVSAANSIIVDVLGNGYATPPTAISNRILYSHDDGAYNDNAQYEVSTGAGDVTFTWTLAADDYAMIMASFKEIDAIDQEGFRFRNDDGDEGGAGAATWMEDQDIDAEQTIDTNTRLRMILASDGDPVSTQFQLGYKKSTDSDWRKTPTGSTIYDPASSVGEAHFPTTDNTASLGPTITFTPPGSIQTGDLVVAIVHYRASTVTINVGNDGGQSWTATNQQTYSTTNALRIFYCIYDGTWDANPSFTVGSGTVAMTGQMLAFRNASSTLDVATTMSGYAATTAVNITGTTTQTDNALVLAVWSSQDNNTWGSLSSGWYAPGIGYIRNTSNGSISAAYMVNSDPGATGDVSKNQSGADAGITALMAFQGSSFAAPVLISASSNISPGGEYTTAQLDPPSGKTGNFATGRIQDDENPADAVDIGSNGYTELEWSIKATDAATVGDVYQFRVTRKGVPLTYYSKIPELTIIEGATGISVSGTSNMRTGSTVRVAVNGALDGTHVDTINASTGNWSISSVTVGSGNSVIVFVEDSDANESTAATLYDGSGDITGMVLDQNVFSIGSVDNQNLALSNLDDYQNSDNENVMYSVSSSTLTVDDDGVYSAEKIDILSGNTLTIGGTETLTTYNLTITGTLSSGGASTYSVAHDWANNGAFTQSTSTINFNGSGTQTIGGSATTTFNNVSTANTANATTGIATNIGGTLSIGNGSTFTAAGYALTVTGTTTVGGGTSGSLVISSATGTKTFVGLVTVANGATWNNSGNSAVTFRGGITNNATFTAGSGVHTFDTNAQALTGTLSISNVTVTGVTLTNNNTLTVGTALSGTGGLTQAASSTLNIGGTSGITTLTATNSGNTVNYTGAAQTVHTGNYWHLTLSGSGTKTLQTGTTAVGGNLIFSGTAAATGVVGLSITGTVTLGSGTSFTAGSYTHNVAGNWTNNGGTFTGTGSTINFNGSSNQSVTTGSSSFYNLTITNASASPGVTFTDGTSVSNLFKDITAASTLTFTAGTTSTLADIQLHGATSPNYVTIRSTTTSAANWHVTKTAPQTDVSYVSVSYNNAAGSGDFIDATNGTNYDGGHNDSYWHFTAAPALSITCASAAGMTDYTLGNPNNYNSNYFADGEKCTVTDNTSNPWTLTLDSSYLIGASNNLANTNIKISRDADPASAPTTTTGAGGNVVEPAAGDYSLDTIRTIADGSASANGDYDVRATVRLENLNTLRAENGDTATLTFTIQ
jgi:hypothetical protein